MRPTIIAANWKMHKTIDQALHFIKELLSLTTATGPLVLIAPPYTCLARVAEELLGVEGMSVCAQNMSDKREGPWTGEISASMIKDAGADFVLIGHSERRNFFGETDAIVNQKIRAACLGNLQPIVCVGESLQDREQKLEKEKVEEQLIKAMAGLSLEEAERVILAYEPIWAIGTGKNASVEIAQEMHVFCRQVLEKIWSSSLAKTIPILYGGSVSPSNAEALLSQPDIDGVLVGGASLEAVSFSQIINANVSHLEA